VESRPTSGKKIIDPLRRLSILIQASGAFQLLGESVSARRSTPGYGAAPGKPGSIQDPFTGRCF
jgi:hypothetical protein